jgi:RNA polymerase sigma-70 factor (ECF subfamily)
VNAVAELFRRHHEALLRFLCARTRSMEEARDVAQEAYARLLALDRPGTVSYLEGYIWRIAGNIVTDRQRELAVRARATQHLVPDAVPQYPSPERQWAARQRLALLERAMQELPEPTRTAFVLRIFDELPFEQVAARVSVDIRSAKRYVARALAHCQHVINEAEAGWSGST